MAKALWLIIPVKMLALGKQRLAGVLSDEQRRQLAEAMLKDMLLALKNCQGIDDIVLVSKDAAVKSLAETFAVKHLAEPEDCQGLNAAVQFALRAAEEALVEKALILHGDIPAIAAADIELLLQKARAEVCLVPDAHDNGTNAMVLSLPSKMQPAYGESSFDQHLTIAHDLGLSCQIVRSASSLQHDIDVVDDLQNLADAVSEKSYTSQLLTSDIWQNTLHSVA